MACSVNRVCLNDVVYTLFKGLRLPWFCLSLVSLVLRQDLFTDKKISSRCFMFVLADIV